MIENGSESSPFFSAYPNPFKNGFDIFIGDKNLSNGSQFIITDVVGRVVEKLNYSTGNKIYISAGWESGIYFIRLTDGSKSFAIQKIVKI